MPRYVDHDARRAEMATIAADLIAERGVEQVSLRDVAAAAGFSTTVVTHYFAGRRELLQHAYRSAVRRTEERVSAIPADAPDRLLALCEAVLPLDRERRRTWQTWSAFFGVAVADPELAAMQRRRVAGFRRVLATTIADELEAGTAPSGVAADDAARRLLVVVHGIAAEAVFDPRDWPRWRQLEVVTEEIHRLRTSTDARSTPA